MDFELELIFSKKADMNAILEVIDSICKKTGSVLLNQDDNSLILGADAYEKMGPAFIRLSFSDIVKTNIIDAIWTDIDEGSHSCKHNLLC